MKSKKIGMNCTSIALMVAASMNATYVSAQSTDNSEELEKVLVWGTEVKSSSLFLKQQTIDDKQADHISDLLRVIPGIDVGGAHSLNQRITIRSMDDKDLEVSIDGARQNAYMYHHMGNLQIHADILKSVDINVGSNSVINGGLGGAVRFETKQAKDLLTDDQSFGVRLQVGTGTNSGQSYSATAYGQITDETDFLIYHNVVNRENYEVGGGKILDQDGVEIADTNGEVLGLEGDLRDTLFKFGWDVDNNQRLEFGYETYQDKGNYSYRPDMGLATDLAITNALGIPLLWPTELTRDTLTANYELTIDNTLVKAAAYQNTSELNRDESGWADNEAFAGNAAIVKGTATNTGANIIANTQLDTGLQQSITYGIDFVSHDTEYKAQYAASTDNSGEQSSTLALFAENKISVNDALHITPGLRYEMYDIESMVVDNDFSDLSMALALEYLPIENLLFRLSATEVFKGPEISEVFIGAGLYDTANADIKAETGMNIEFAFAYEVELNDQQSIALGATVFETNIDNYIYDYATIPADIGSGSWKDNIGDMHIQGFESYFEYAYNDLSALFTYSRAESELSAFTDYVDLEKARLDRQQGNTLSFNLDYKFTNTELVLHWETMKVDDVPVGIDLDGATLDNSKSGFTVSNLSARWSPSSVDGLTLIVGVDNVFDEFYASQSSRTGVSFHPLFGSLYLQDYEPGRNIKATVQYRF